MLKPYLADLHIHTVLSACAEVEMIPPLILRQAERLGLSVIAITDHNACHNVEAVIEAADGTGVHVLPGMETPVERRGPSPLSLRYGLPVTGVAAGGVSEAPSPCQPGRGLWAAVLVDSMGDWRATEERLLASSVDMALGEVISKVRELGGMVIPAHVDRPSFSLLSNLGFVPEGIDVHGLEVTPGFVPDSGFQRWPQLKTWCLIVNGDAHRLQEIQHRTLLKISAPRVQEISLALQGLEGRKVVVDWPKLSES